jgi:adenylate kinase
VRGIVGICGTPGTGKKTVAPLVAREVGLPAAISINSLAPKDEFEVDTTWLRKEAVKLVPPRSVLYGHLLPHVLRKSETAFVAILRCDPSVLRKRLEKRGYSAEKVLENVEAELIGVVLDECLRRFGAAVVHEYDTTSASPSRVARDIVRDVGAAAPGGKRTRSPAKWIDWTLDYGSSSKLRSLLAGARDPPAST